MVSAWIINCNQTKVESHQNEPELRLKHVLSVRLLPILLLYMFCCVYNVAFSVILSGESQNKLALFHVFTRHFEDTDLSSEGIDPTQQYVSYGAEKCNQ